MPDSTRIPPELIDLALVGTTTSYALWLWTYRRRPAPHTTWVKVVIGDAICLTAAALRARLSGGDWRAYEHAVWWSFIVGGLPIVVGELIQTIERRAELEERRANTAPPGWE